MLLLFESATGYALFKVVDEGRLSDINSLHKLFRDAHSAQKVYVNALLSLATRQSVTWK